MYPSTRHNSQIQRVSWTFRTAWWIDMHSCLRSVHIPQQHKGNRRHWLHHLSACFTIPHRSHTVTQQLTPLTAAYSKLVCSQSNTRGTSYQLDDTDDFPRVIHHKCMTGM